MLNKFVVQSTEDQNGLQYHCTFLNKLESSNKKPIRVLVQVDPKISRDVFHGDLSKNIFAPNLVDDDIDMLMLSPRLEGSHVYPEISDPCYVYICIPEKSGNWINGPWRILDWGEINLAAKKR